MSWFSKKPTTPTPPAQQGAPEDSSGNAGWRTGTYRCEREIDTPAVSVTHDCQVQVVSYPVRFQFSITSAEELANRLLWGAKVARERLAAQAEAQQEATASSTAVTQDQL